MTHIAIIDYGMGNLRSVAKALEHVAPGARISVTQERRDILRADRVVFPGQGSIRDCMRELARWELLDVVRESALGKPFLGLCLGPQALLSFSEENGGIDCLGVLPGRVVWFGDLRDPDSGERLKVPHMGWNQVHQLGEHPLWRGIPQDSRFYFVHSYYLQPEDAALVTGRTEYGFGFASAIARDNMFAVQFHPEKSAQAGLRLLANFAGWNP
ncbi:MAG: imidazole glycerol phosphate synthase subunit HisH [Candidatus Competibacteraceae bacterium]|nr:imidazole glycerol phosphate synthase subunit HisH [Candidatus Competibacteraceae bacterium]MBK8897260.1 imidazole glycerol phosphate synthase subunit HisH [Candidatus Competibacteraceae bacterium]MBK8964749.1 imidazole glycerol phosphate synthase subunit HisH [Candidatus Competibacteraceae bacterium]MBK9950026.1 imidazole glycerol phosphate synthase subunit HisH [Candidatus Competibacteraceae bacterium]